jgi:predicted lipoprotein with Yx(FWY)xxD motif
LKNPFTLGCITVAAVALAAGCGSSSNSSTTASTSASAPTTTATQAASKSAYAATGASGNPSASSATGVTITVKHSKLGTILAAGPKHMTVYLFEGDKGGTSTCAGACAAAWPPVATGGRPQSSGEASSDKLGTIMRANGVKQVTYNGHPLYFFVKDGDAGDAYGQGAKAFGADWYVLSPSGEKIDDDGGSGGGGSAS